MQVSIYIFACPTWLKVHLTKGWIKTRRQLSVPSAAEKQLDRNCHKTAFYVASISLVKVKKTSFTFGSGY